MYPLHPHPRYIAMHHYCCCLCCYAFASGFVVVACQAAQPVLTMETSSAFCMHIADMFPPQPCDVCHAPVATSHVQLLAQRPSCIPLPAGVQSTTNANHPAQHQGEGCCHQGGRVVGGKPRLGRQLLLCAGDGRCCGIDTAIGTMCHCEGCAHHTWECRECTVRGD